MKRIREEFISKPNEDLLIEKQTQEAASVFVCRGSLSLVNHSRLKELEEQIFSAEGQKVVLDLRDVSYVDSSGLGTLAAALKKTMEQKRVLEVVANTTVRKTISAAGLESVFRLYDTVDAALSAPN